MKLLRELYQSRKGLINVRNINNNEFLKWCLVRYLNRADYTLTTITKSDKDFGKIERDLILALVIMSFFRFAYTLPKVDPKDM